MLETELLLHSLGITSNYKGHRILIMAVEIALQDENALNDIMVSVYGVVAEKLGVSAASVERNIRTAISHAWELASNRFRKTVDWSGTYQPTSSELITLLVEKTKQAQESDD